MQQWPRGCHGESSGEPKTRIMCFRRLGRRFRRLGDLSDGWVIFRNTTGMEAGLRLEAQHFPKMCSIQKLKLDQAVAMSQPPSPVAGAIPFNKNYERLSFWGFRLPNRRKRAQPSESRGGGSTW